MNKQPSIVLVGKSLLMDGIAHSLADRRMPCVYRIDPRGAADLGNLAALGPDMIVFEQGSPYLDPFLCIMAEQPGLRLLELDLTGHRAILLHSRQHEVRTMADLCEIIETQLGKVGGTEDVLGKTQLASY